MAYVRFVCSAGETFAGEPVGFGGAAGFEYVFCATHAAAAGGGEGDDGFAGKVVRLEEGAHDGGCNVPPDGELKCSPSSPALENTGLNGLHKCVFCSFLVAYCSDLSHLLYSASPVYTNTYV